MDGRMDGWRRGRGKGVDDSEKWNRRYLLPFPILVAAVECGTRFFFRGKRRVQVM